MKKLIVSLLLTVVSAVAWSAEIVKIYSPYSPGHSGTPAMRRIIDQANADQSIYKFVLEFKPGGNQILAVKAIEPENSLAIIAPAFVENAASGKLNQNDYVPVHALGDACWVGITNGPLAGRKELVVGSVGVGNGTHLTSLMLADRYKFDVRFVMFKSNYDSLINMAGNNGVDFVIERYESFEALRESNRRLQLVGASCPNRIPQAPNLKTFKEMGLDVPYIFNIAVAHKDMPVARRTAIEQILNSATLRVGQQEIYRISSMRPPIFDGISTSQFYKQSIDKVVKLQAKYRDKITQAQ